MIKGVCCIFKDENNESIYKSLCYRFRELKTRILHVPELAIEILLGIGYVITKKREEDHKMYEAPVEGCYCQTCDSFRAAKM